MEMLSLPRDILYTNTGEDKLDDLNFCVGIKHSLPLPERTKAFETLVAYFDRHHAQIVGLLGCEFQTQVFPKISLVNVFIKGILEKRRFDKQGKSYGWSVVERITEK